jgi:type IV pilus assembly protein PilX
MTMNIQNRLNTGKQQQGLVLFIALIALVAMSLAAAALIRSVDSTTLVAGNLAFKQSATMSADASIAEASDYVNTHGLTLGTPDAINGYYPTTANDTAALNYLDLKAAATWNNGASKLASGTGFTAGKDTSGNTVRYVVQRMCKINTGISAKPANDCLLGTAVSGGSSKKGLSGVSAGIGQVNSGSSIMYRVTSRVTGPKNTVSLIQTYVY